MVNNERRVLIVDDEASIRRLLRQKLSKAGFVCEEANSGEQALVRLESNRIELVILDVNMPGKSGIEVLQEIKEYHHDTAVIMATAVAETKVAVVCMKQGADDYICKPFNLDEVIMSVERTL